MSNFKILGGLAPLCSRSDVHEHGALSLGRTKGKPVC